MIGDGACVVVDVGSTTTKAILVERGRLAGRGEAPTTVEAPFEDVGIGFDNALRDLAEITGRAVGRLPCLATSSAGGGLQMLVAGVVRGLSAASAQRAALGAGAVVVDVLALDDGRPVHERIERLRRLRPDMILLAGGLEGGTVSHVLEVAEWIAAARPRPRLEPDVRLPVVYAGNSAAVPDVVRRLEGLVELHVVPNLRPSIDRERLEPAREAIHDLFLQHVMARAPGYDRLCARLASPVLPTPVAAGAAVRLLAEEIGRVAVAVDIGGATTDVFSFADGRFARTVSANLGMSYSVRNVLASAGTERVAGWLPEPLPPAEVRDRVANKAVRPTSIPATPQDLALEHALCREALRLAFQHHRALVRDAAGSLPAGIRGLLHREAVRSPLDTGALGLLVASGGVLSHAPRRSQTALMLIDAFQPVGATWLALDDGFLLPHVGALAAVDPAAAALLLGRDCLVWLGTAVTPGGSRRLRLRLDGRETSAAPGELAARALPRAQRFTAEVAGGAPVAVHGGTVGLILDCRGRPLAPRAGQSAVWLRALEDAA